MRPLCAGSVGVICEYNPFHLRPRAAARRAPAAAGLGMRPSSACMSGNYVQRGEPAVVPARACAPAAAVNAAGRHLVLELPVTSDALQLGRGLRRRRRARCLIRAWLRGRC
ncbi:MAG: nucleotidyltransferase family protein [Blautia wexlerae]